MIIQFFEYVVNSKATNSTYLNEPFSAKGPLNISESKQNVKIDLEEITKYIQVMFLICLTIFIIIWLLKWIHYTRFTQKCCIPKK